MESLRRATDFERVYHEGRVVKAAALRLCYYYRGDQKPSRVAFVASKKIGGAVVRNRVKRQLRESWRRVAPPQEGWDFVLVPNRRIIELTFEEIVRDVALLLGKAARNVKESN